VDDFPPNSHTSKDTAPRQERVEEKPEKKVEKVVSGNVIRRKKPLGARIKETFILGDGQTVLQHILAEVVVPATKDLIADTATSMVERMLFGEANYSRSRSRSRYRSSNENYVTYSQRPSSQRRPPWSDDKRQPREISRRRRSSNDFQEIILETRAECEEVIDQMFDLTEKYKAATVADLLELIGADTTYTDDKWGWYDVRDFNIRRIQDGYLLDIPRPEALK